MEWLADFVVERRVWSLWWLVNHDVFPNHLQNLSKFPVLRVLACCLSGRRGEYGDFFDGPTVLRRRGVEENVGNKTCLTGLTLTGGDADNTLACGGGSLTLGLTLPSMGSSIPNTAACKTTSGAFNKSDASRPWLASCSIFLFLLLAASCLARCRLLRTYPRFLLPLFGLCRPMITHRKAPYNTL